MAIRSQGRPHTRNQELHAAWRSRLGPGGDSGSERGGEESGSSEEEGTDEEDIDVVDLSITVDEDDEEEDDDGWRCEWCQCTREETRWPTKGPSGPSTLCESCGQRHRKGRHGPAQRQERRRSDLDTTSRRAPPAAAKARPRKRARTAAAHDNDNGSRQPRQPNDDDEKELVGLLADMHDAR